MEEWHRFFGRRRTGPPSRPGILKQQVLSAGRWSSSRSLSFRPPERGSTRSVTSREICPPYCELKRKGLVAVASFQHVIAVALQYPAGCRPQNLVIFDQEDGFRAAQASGQTLGTTRWNAPDAPRAAGKS